MNMQHVDNALSPHGGTLVDRCVADKEKAVQMVDDCAAVLRIRGTCARNLINIAYGFYSPLEGFMNRKEVESVCNNMTLSSGHLWSLPIVCDITPETEKQLGIKEGDYVLMEYHNIPFAVLQVDEIFSFDKDAMIRSIYGMNNVDHPGVKAVHALSDRFLSGPVWLINPPVFHDPYDQFFFTPKTLREKFRRRHWNRVLAFHTTSVPHLGHEWLMKASWFLHQAKGMLVSCAVGEKRLGDCIDECVLLCHKELVNAGYFRDNTHVVSMMLWDRWYAGPREAVMHAIMRKNLGCTGHVFGKNHAQPEGTADSWAAHYAFRDLPDLGISSVLSKEWFYCEQCGGMTYSDFCGHNNRTQKIESQSVCSLLSTGVRPPMHLLRSEVFDTTIGAADKYGFGDGYVTQEYLVKRNPIFTLNKF